MNNDSANEKKRESMRHILNYIGMLVFMLFTPIMISVSKAFMFDYTLEIFVFGYAASLLLWFLLVRIANRL